MVVELPLGAVGAVFPRVGVVVDASRLPRGSVRAGCHINVSEGGRDQSLFASWRGNAERM